MKDNFALLETLDRLFGGARESVLTLDDFLGGLQGRSYAFAILLLDLPNCLPTGIPWLSTITGVPMLLLLFQLFSGRPAPSLPKMIGRRGLRRGKLQDFLGRGRRYIARLENAVHARHEWLVTGMPRRLLQIAWALNVLLLALPIPFDNLLPAFAILFFCLALIEDDGVMALLGWLFSLITVVWTIFLLIIGRTAIVAALEAVHQFLFN
jgi:hypothetical protein